KQNISLSPSPRRPFFSGSIIVALAASLVGAGGCSSEFGGTKAGSGGDAGTGGSQVVGGGGASNSGGGPASGGGNINTGGGNINAGGSGGGNISTGGNINTGGGGNISTGGMGSGGEPCVEVQPPEDPEWPGATCENWATEADACGEDWFSEYCDITCGRCVPE